MSKNNENKSQKYRVIILDDHQEKNDKKLCQAEEDGYEVQQISAYGCERFYGCYVLLVRKDESNALSINENT